MASMEEHFLFETLYLGQRREGVRGETWLLLLLPGSGHINGDKEHDVTNIITSGVATSREVSLPLNYLFL